VHCHHCIPCGSGDDGLECLTEGENDDESIDGMAVSRTEAGKAG
jgi:hypothetical protein